MSYLGTKRRPAALSDWKEDMEFTSGTMDPNKLPLCANAAPGAYCRNYIGGSPVKKPGTAPAKPSSSSGSDAASVAGKIFGALFANATAPAITPQQVYTPPAGPSMTTLAIGGAAALGILYFALKD